MTENRDELIPTMMKKVVEDKYFNIPCDERKCNNYPIGPCFTCGRQYKYYFNEIDKIDESVQLAMIQSFDNENNKIDFMEDNEDLKLAIALSLKDLEHKK